MSFLSYAKNFQGVGEIFMRDSKRYLPFVQLLDNVMSCESEMTQAQREMVALYSSAVNSCNYCVGSHSSVLNSLGAQEDHVCSLAEGSLAQVEDRMKEMLSFAQKLAVEPGKVVKADIDTVRAAGWSEQAIEDAICVVSTFAFLNRLVDGFGLEGNDAHFDQVGGMVSQQGYSPLVKMIEQKASAAA